MPITKLPTLFSIPGLINGGGINRSCNRMAVPLGHAWICRNVIPYSQGYGNENIGWSKQNTNRLTTDVIRGGVIFDNKHIYARDGNLYRQNVGGGAETLIASGIFDASSRISFAKNRGTGIDKLYMCDGANIPRAWDGTTLSQVTAFTGTILSTIPTTSRPSMVYSFRSRLVWGFKNTDPFKNTILDSKYDDGDTYTTTGASTDPFFTDVNAGDGSYITGFGQLKRNLETDQASQLLVFKPKSTYMGRDFEFAGSVVSQVFDLQAFDMGAINHQSIINFSNSLVTLSRQGFASLDSATVSGGIDALTYQFGLRVNEFVSKNAQLNVNFDKAFMIHSPQQQVFMAFMPQNDTVDTNLNGYGYPEIPNNYAIAYFYGVQDKQGQPINQWVDFLSVGFAASTGWVDENGDIYLGSYFGDIYKAFVSEQTEFERNPSTPTTKAIFTSAFMTGDHSLDDDLDKAKSLKNLELFWFTDVGVTANLIVYYDGKEDGIIITNQRAGAAGDIALYDSGYLYDSGNLYSFTSNASMHVAPPGIGNMVRILIEWDSEYKVSPGVYKTNAGSLHALSSSLLQLGGKNFRRRR